MREARPQRSRGGARSRLIRSAAAVPRRVRARAAALTPIAGPRVGKRAAQAWGPPPATPAHPFPRQPQALLGARSPRAAHLREGARPEARCAAGPRRGGGGWAPALPDAPPPAVWSRGGYEARRVEAAALPVFSPVRRPRRREAEEIPAGVRGKAER